MAAAQGAAVTVRAPAKINLQLSVGLPGADGYHPLATVFHAVSLYDEVTASPLPDGSGVQVEVDGDAAGAVPRDGTNLAVRAARLLAEQTGVPADVRLRIHKEIPVAGGMAGGSADAAAALVACNRLWRTGLSRKVLSGLAAELGSDVPFALLGGTAVGIGRGERLTPVATNTTLHWVFALAQQGISTAAAYRELDRLGGGSTTPADAILEALTHGDPKLIAARLYNDLQPAALSLAPELRHTLDAGRELGALGGIVSGSGPTCAFLAASREEAVRLAAELAAEGGCWAARVATGPAVPLSAGP
jgi:4-diphosphocytidyl-2-C-methyl-D-erythritol kinase